MFLGMFGLLLVLFVTTELLRWSKSTVINSNCVGLLYVDSENVGLVDVDSEKIGLVVVDSENVGLVEVDSDFVGGLADR